MKYLGRRLLRAGLLLVGVSALCFLFTEMAPGSFFDEMRLNPQISPETIAALRTRYGLDQPLPVRYVRWMAAVIRGDFGYSIAYNTPVAPLLWARAKNRAKLRRSRLLQAPWARGRMEHQERHSVGTETVRLGCADFHDATRLNSIEVGRGQASNSFQGQHAAYPCTDTPLSPVGTGNTDAVRCDDGRLHTGSYAVSSEADAHPH